RAWAHRLESAPRTVPVRPRGLGTGGAYAIEMSPRSARPPTPHDTRGSMPLGLTRRVRLCPPEIPTRSPGCRPAYAVAPGSEMARLELRSARPPPEPWECHSTPTPAVETQGVEVSKV